MSQIDSLYLFGVLSFNYNFRNFYINAVIQNEDYNPDAMVK